MLAFLSKYLSYSDTSTSTHSSSVATFVHALINKLEADVQTLAKGPSVSVFTSLFNCLILTSLKEHLDCINKGQPSAEELLPLTTILNLLERLCQWPVQQAQVQKAGTEFSPNQYPTLKRLLDSDSSASSAIADFIKARSRQDQNARKLWQALFTDSSETSGGTKGPDTAELKATTRSATIYDAHENLIKLYNVISQHVKSAECHYSWQSMLANLESGRLDSEVTDESSGSFRLFLTNSHTYNDVKLEYWWQDVQIHIVKKILVRFEESGLADGLVNTKMLVPELPTDEKPVKDVLCLLFKDRKPFQQCFTYSSYFERKDPRHPGRRFRQNHPSVPLSRLLGHELTPKTRALLSFRLMRSLWELFHSNWIGENWNKDDIQFMLEPSTEELKISAHEPFLQARFHKFVSDAQEFIQQRSTEFTEQYQEELDLYSKRPHRYPKILALGIILLEIELGQTIEEAVGPYFYHPESDLDPIHTKHIMAIEILDNVQLWAQKEIYKVLKEIIEICIRPVYEKLEKTDDLRQNLLDEVVQPFKNFLVNAWPEDQRALPLSLKTSTMPSCKFDRPPSSVDARMHTEKSQFRVTTHQNHSYTIGWITALAVEMAMAQGMLDEVHEQSYKIEGDTNSYVLGRLGSHKVVITCLPSMGNNNAAMVATNLLRSFQNVRIGLMVGIGGGVPTVEDIRLGDIVVSEPTGTHGGVIQYDFGTAIQTLESFSRKGHLNQPPIAILAAMKCLQAKILLHNYQFERHLDAMIKNHPNMVEQCKRPLKDQLYERDHVHKSNQADCSQCGDARLVHRKPRSVTKVHYGTIGSGNEVIRDAILRDALHERDKLICFEMEAAGLMNNFPCIVIRGICDYCDSHKNDDWQPYAAGIAAAFAKELLLTIPSTHVENTATAGNVLSTQ